MRRALALGSWVALGCAAAPLGVTAEREVAPMATGRPAEDATRRRPEARAETPPAQVEAADAEPLEACEDRPQPGDAPVDAAGFTAATFDALEAAQAAHRAAIAAGYQAGEVWRARARADYEEALRGYERVIPSIPPGPEWCRTHYFRGEVLRELGRDLEAADDHRAARDACSEGCLGAYAAYGVIAALEQYVGDGRGRRSPPPATGTPPRVERLPIPRVVQDLVEAREAYIRLVPEERRPGWPDMHAGLRYANARVDLNYGRFEEARQVFEALAERGCRSGDFREQKLGSMAWGDLRRMALHVADYATARRMGEELSARDCGITPVGLACRSEEGFRALCVPHTGHPCCLADGSRGTIVDIMAVLQEHRDALAMPASSQRRERLRYVATRIGEIVAFAPSDGGVPLLLDYEARAHEEAGDTDEALATYRRLETEYARRVTAGAERIPELERFIAERIRALAPAAN
ncbi:MAG: hypothetical protein AAGH15_18800 [Myxococcota bacterium]